MGWTEQAFGSEYAQRLMREGAEAGFQILKLAIVYLLLRWFVVHAVRRVARPVARLEKDPVRARRVQTLGSLASSAALYVLALVFGIMVLKALGVDPVPLLTAAGVAGLAIGFGAQKLVRDVINGFFILLENQFTVGEIVTIGMVTGTVCEVGLRTTRINDPQGKLFILSNGDISTVCNHSRNDLTVPLEISVAASADLEKASRELDAAGQAVSSRYGLTVAYRSQGISAFDAAKVTLKVVGSVPPEEQEAVLRDLREEIRQRLQRADIPVV